MEESCRLISSRGLMKLCTVYPASVETEITTVSEFMKLYTFSDDQVHESGSVYVKTEWILFFIHSGIYAKFKKWNLVSGSSDHPVPSKLISEQVIRIVLELPGFNKWFCQNCMIDSDDVIPLPIGLDYHTRYKRELLLPISHEEIIRTSGCMNKDPRLYCGFHFGMEGAGIRGRVQAMHEIYQRPESEVYVEPFRVSDPKEYYKRLSRFQYSASPPGNGVDCHRHWEIIACGGVPVVYKSKFNKIFRVHGFPFIELDKYSDQLPVVNRSKDIRAMKIEYWEELFRLSL